VKLWVPPPGRAVLSAVASAAPHVGIPRDLTWQLKAACRGLVHGGGTDWFFPPDNPGGPKAGKGVTGEKERVEKAKAVCAECPVMQECLKYAIENECHGIWGGTTDSERKKLGEMILRRG
jgi:WhiB family transcriptional regulator, redox-sensing transcriptional regulator